MTSAVPKVAVVGCGISGAVCASNLARNGAAVTVFDLGRGPGGRMSQRRVTNPAVLDIVLEWESRGLVAEWKEKFGTFDCISKKFIDCNEESSSRKFVGIPGMNSICTALCNEPGIERKFGTGVAKMAWVDENSWSLIGINGQFLGNFDALVATDKLLASPGFSKLTGYPPPLDMNLAPALALQMKEIPVRACFALMLAFSEPFYPCSQISVGGLSFINSKVLTSAVCDSSKPCRSLASQRWVLHSTAEYAKEVIAQTGLQKPSIGTLTRVSEELLQEFQETGLCTSQPFFMKAHRWGSAFPTASIATEHKCLWDLNKRLVVCGDFCVSPNVEGALASGLAASKKLLEMV